MIDDGQKVSVADDAAWAGRELGGDERATRDEGGDVKEVEKRGHLGRENGPRRALGGGVVVASSESVEAEGEEQEENRERREGGGDWDGDAESGGEETELGDWRAGR